MGCQKLDISENHEPTLEVVGKNPVPKNLQVAKKSESKFWCVNYYPFGMLMPTCETPIESYLATMEGDREEIERAQFYESYDSINITAMSHMNHTDSLDKLKLLALDKDGSAAQGLRKTVPVLQGDSIVMQAYAKFLPNLSKDKSKEMSLPIMAILAPLTYLTPIGEYGMQVAKLIPPILNLPLPLLGGDSYEGTPTAYLNYRLYNKDSVLIDSAQIAVSEDAMDGAKPSGKAKRDTLDDTHDHLMLTKGIKEDGYIEVYLSNTSDQEYRVYFDDYQITRMENALCEADEIKYSYGFNGYEVIKEWNGTENDYVFEGYGYDARLGRRKNRDPLTDKYHDFTSYGFAGDNPIWFRDVYGKIIKIASSDPDFVNNTFNALQQLTSEKLLLLKDNTVVLLHNNIANVKLSEQKTVVKAGEPSGNNKDFGTALIESLTTSENVISIIPTTDGNSTTPDIDKNVKGTTGKRTGSVIKLNTSPTNKGGFDVKGSRDRPLSIGLGHELLHSYINNLGESNLKNTNFFDPERLIFGVDLTSEDRFKKLSFNEVRTRKLENFLRFEQGLPLRISPTLFPDAPVTTTEADVELKKN